MINNEKLSEIIFTLKNKTNIDIIDIYTMKLVGICIVSLHIVKHFYSSDLAERDIIHNTLLAFHSLQLYSRNLHQESVLVTIKFQ